MKKNAGRPKKIERTIHPKNGIIPLLGAYSKNQEKLLQWIEGIAQET